jgi:hypothetical protein
MMLEATRKNCRERGRRGPCESDLETKGRKVGSSKEFTWEGGGHDSYLSSSLFTAHHP